MKTGRSVADIKSHIRDHRMAYVYFSQKNCGVCHMVLPKVEELLKPYPEIIGLQVDMEEVMKASGTFSVFTVPCFLLYLDGTEVFRMARFFNFGDFREKVERIMELYKGRDL